MEQQQEPNESYWPRIQAFHLGVSCPQHLLTFTVPQAVNATAIKPGYEAKHAATSCSTTC